MATEMIVCDICDNITFFLTVNKTTKEILRECEDCGETDPL